LRRRDGTAELSSAARQLSYALEGSAGAADAFRKLYAASDAERRPALERLERLLQSAQSEDAAHPRGELPSWPTLAWVLRRVSAPHRAAAAVLAAFIDDLRFGDSAARLARREFMGFLTYLGGVLYVLIVVSAVFSVFVLPSFADLYAGIGAEPPVLTAFVFGSGSYFFGFVILLAASTALFFSWFVLRLGRELRRLQPLPAFLHRVPLAGPVAAAQERRLWLSVAAWLRAGGLAADRALTLAAERVPVPHAVRWDDPAAPAVMRDLQLASRLGKLDQELEFQRSEAGAALINALARCRRRLRIALSVVIYALVGVYVAAMYEPIFSLGGVNY
jgi:type II secretory pathway component PulF